MILLQEELDYDHRVINNFIMSISITELFKSSLFDKNFKNRIVYFKGIEYPFLFFHLLFQSIKKSSRLNVNFIKINELDISKLKLNFEQYFLGESLFFWLGNISDYKKRNELISYLNLYYGPHSIGFFVNNEIQVESNFKIEPINCDNIATIAQFESLLFLWDASHHKIILQFIKKIFQKYNRLTLDQVCILANYAILLGSRYSNFIDNWLENILVNDYSLFTLSKYFFSHDSKSFFKYWNSIFENYAPVFWTSFWSEQLYRAVNFLNLRNQGKNFEAKQMSYKLPFSFIQSDWKKTSIIELQKSHQHIYNIDYALKNGGSAISLDLFYSKYFAKESR